MIIKGVQSLMWWHWRCWEGGVLGLQAESGRGSGVFAGVRSTMYWKFAPWCSANFWKEATCSNHNVRRWRMIILLRPMLPTWQWGHREHISYLLTTTWTVVDFPSVLLGFPSLGVSLKPTVRLLCTLSGGVPHKSLYFADECTSFPGIPRWQWTHLGPSMQPSRKWEQLGKLLPLDSSPFMDITNSPQLLKLNCKKM